VFNAGVSCCRDVLIVGIDREPVFCVELRNEGFSYCARVIRRPVVHNDRLNVSRLYLLIGYGAKTFAKIARRIVNRHHDGNALSHVLVAIDLG
jgi:hypothetical protein